MKLAIVGSRSATAVNIGEYITELPTLIVSGGAKGIDTLAEEFARAHSIETLIFKPDYKKYGRGAPIRRNEQIILAADKVLAFWDGQSKGTLSSINFAKKHGKQLQIVNL